MAATPARARFVRAVYQLAISPEALQERVGAAWVELMPLRREDLPTAWQAAFAVIEAEMLAAPEDPLALSDEAATAAAERIFQLALALWGD